MDEFPNESNRSITSMEILSNELFYEIFDYLDGCYLYEAFSNLNRHFQQLLNSPCILFKTKYFYSKSNVFINNLKEIMCFHKQQIHSIDLSMSSDMNESFIFDSSFNHLESLVLWRFQPDKLMLILIKLTCLPRLYSLTINMFDFVLDLTNTYQLVFNLPVLKYYKFSGESDLSVALPLATSDQYTTIENLLIDHCCTFNELSSIISYTPKLRYLKFTHHSDGNTNIGILPTIILSNLTYISIHLYNIRFNQFQLFIQKMPSTLKVLCVITQVQDITYLYGYRWEELIEEYLPQLENFSLKYIEYIDKDFVFPVYLEELNQFTSSFWIERQWIFETEIDYEHILYTIRSYKKRWYEYVQEKNVNPSKLTRLNIKDIPYLNTKELLTKYIKRILTIGQIYHLDISEKTSYRLLLEIMNLLPDLNTLKIHSITLGQSLSDEELYLMCLILSKSQITKVYLQEIDYIKEVFFLMMLCPRMVYLEINYVDQIDIKVILRCIFEEDLHEFCDQLRSLCFRLLAADNNIIETLQKMINDEKLLTDYTIERVIDKIYLQWK